MPSPTLHVRIISPQQLLLDTEASSISSKNSLGNFDILAQHANFITLVENTPITVRPARNATPARNDVALSGEHSVAGGIQGKKPLVFKFPIAIIITRDNKVNIYTYIQPKTS